jgi:uncharacterized protein YndB with AHSA1/START domain
MAEQSPPEIEILHRFRAPRVAVWNAWTDPEIVARWWGSDPDGVVTAATLDVTVGGRFVVSFQDSTGETHTSEGVYLHVKPPAELGFTWSWVSEPGNTSRVNVELTADGGETRMRFVHSELRGTSAHDYADGWRRTFAKLDRVLADD